MVLHVTVFPHNTVWHAIDAKNSILRNNNRLWIHTHPLQQFQLSSSVSRAIHRRRHRTLPVPIKCPPPHRITRIFNFTLEFLDSHVNGCFYRFPPTCHHPRVLSSQYNQIGSSHRPRNTLLCHSSTETNTFAGVGLQRPVLVLLTHGYAASGPSALFAPSDSSLRTCFSCCVPSLLRGHLVPGLFTIHHLRKLDFGTKLETRSPGLCITLTSSKSQNDTVSKVFIRGVQITGLDLFNNGIIVIHGIQGDISPLSPLSCEVQRMTWLPFPFQPSDHGHYHGIEAQSPIMSFMLRDVMLRLQNSGFGMLTLAMKVNYQKLIVVVPYIMNSQKVVLLFPGFDLIEIADTDEYCDGGKTTSAAASTSNAPNLLLTAISTSVVGVIAWGTFKFSEMPQCNVELKQQPKSFPIRCTSRDSRSKGPGGRNRGAEPLYKRYSLVELEEALDGKSEIERRFKEIDSFGTKQTKSMKRELRKLKNKVRVVAIDSGTSNVGLALFNKRFDELELQSGETEMLEKVMPLCGFPRNKNKDFISKLVKQIKPDIFVVGNTHGTYWENTDVETYMEELSTYEAMRGKAIALGDEKYTSQMVRYLEEMKCKGLLNLKQMVEDIKFQSWVEIEPYMKDVQSARIILARALCRYLDYKDPSLSVFED